MHEILDWWTSDDSDPRSSLTLVHLLSQTAGFDNTARPNTHVEPCDAAGRNLDTNMEVCAKYIYEHTFCQQPETIFKYDEVNFLLAQHMIMVATGIGTWGEFMDEYFAKPLGS